MRRRDYRCTLCDYLFEYIDSIHDQVIEAMDCPACCGPSSARRQVAVPTIGKINKGVFVTDFPGGHTLTRDEVERRLDYKPPAPFEGDSRLTERLAERLEKVEAQMDAGALPPPRPLTSEQRDMVQKAVKVAES